METLTVGQFGITQPTDHNTHLAYSQRTPWTLCNNKSPVKMCWYKHPLLLPHSSCNVVQWWSIYLLHLALHVLGQYWVTPAESRPSSVSCCLVYVLFSEAMLSLDQLHLEDAFAWTLFFSLQLLLSQLAVIVHIAWLNNIYTWSLFQRIPRCLPELLPEHTQWGCIPPLNHYLNVTYVKPLTHAQ